MVNIERLKEVEEKLKILKIGGAMPLTIFWQKAMPGTNYYSFRSIIDYFEWRGLIKIENVDGSKMVSLVERDGR